MIKMTARRVFLPDAYEAALVGVRVFRAATNHGPVAVRAPFSFYHNTVEV